MNTSRLIDAIMPQYPLSLTGVHGPTHWDLVWENGRHLAALTGADPQVVALFALLHDCRRTTEGEDYEHGQEAAYFARTLRGKALLIDDHGFELLYEACARHADGETEADITIQTCWDADRLDLGRVGIRPDPDRLCTEAARDPDLIAWASQRAGEGFCPSVLDDWLAEDPWHR